MSPQPTGILLAGAVAVFAACSSSTGSGTPDGPSVCPKTIAALCSLGDAPSGPYGIHCLSMVGAAEAESDFCMAGFATEATCGTLTVISVGGLDTADVYYYDASGALIAVTSIDFADQQHCVAGDGTFAIPHAACTSMRTLPACATDGGAGG